MPSLEEGGKGGGGVVVAERSGSMDGYLDRYKWQKKNESLISDGLTGQFGGVITTLPFSPFPRLLVLLIPPRFLISFLPFFPPPLSEAEMQGTMRLLPRCSSIPQRSSAYGGDLGRQRDMLCRGIRKVESSWANILSFGLLGLQIQIIFRPSQSISAIIEFSVRLAHL